MHIGADTACTADRTDAVFLGVEIIKQLCLDIGIVKSAGTTKSDFFLYGKQTFQFRVCKAVIGKNRHHHRNRNAVIAAKGGSVGAKPAILDNQRQRIACEIMHLIRALDADHIGVSLQHDDRLVFVAFGRRFADQNIVHVIAAIRKVVFLCKCAEKIRRTCFIVRAVRDGAQLFKIPQNIHGLITVQYKFHNVIPP